MNGYTSYLIPSIVVSVVVYIMVFLYHFKSKDVMDSRERNRLFKESVSVSLLVTFLGVATQFVMSSI